MKPVHFRSWKEVESLRLGSLELGEGGGQVEGGLQNLQGGALFSLLWTQVSSFLVKRSPIQPKYINQ